MNLIMLVRLRNLIELVLAKKMSICDFCDEFEHLYNFELEKKELTENERSTLEELFNKVVYYSPFAEDRQKIENYLGDEEIIQSAKVACNVLSMQINGVIH